MILYDLPKINSNIESEKLFIIPYEKEKMKSPARPTRVAHAETTRTGKSPCASTIWQKRPQTFPKLQIRPNTISPSLRTSHLTP